jgi:NTE family protein
LPLIETLPYLFGTFLQGASEFADRNFHKDMLQVLFLDTNPLPVVLGEFPATLLPTASLPVIAGLIMTGCWYVIGLVLDRHETASAEDSKNAPGYLWTLAIVSLFSWICAMSQAKSYLVSQFQFLGFHGVLDALSWKKPLPGRFIYIWTPVLAAAVWSNLWVVVFLQVSRHLRRFRAAKAAWGPPRNCDEELANPSTSSRSPLTRHFLLLAGMPLAIIFLLSTSYNHRVWTQLCAAVALSAICIECFLSDFKIDRASWKIVARWIKAQRAWRTPVYAAIVVLSVLLLRGDRSIFRQERLAATLILALGVLYSKWLVPTLNVREWLQNVRVWMRSWRPKHYFVSLLIVWVLVCIYIQQRLIFSKALTVLLAGIAIKVFFPRSHAYRWIFWSVVPLVAALTVVGSYDQNRDLFFVLGAFVLAYSYWTSAARRGIPLVGWKSGAILLISGWALCSAGDLFFLGWRASLRPERFLESAPKAASLSKHIGIALSGGGYRAAVLHAGILSGMEKQGLRVTHISSVSGGSITAAYYALGGEPEEVLDSVINHRFDLYRDFFDLQNAPRLLASVPIPGTHVRLFPFARFSRTDLQAQALDRVLLQRHRLRSLPPGAPQLMICVTDLNTGRAIGITDRWMTSRFLLQPPGEERFPNAKSLYEGLPRLSYSSTFQSAESGNQKLSDLVAASGAFPLAFSPVRLISKAYDGLLLADGGVTDNSGMTLLLDADWRASPRHESAGDKTWALDLAISADGGAMFKQQRPNDGADLTGATSSVEAVGRAIDIIHSRIGLQLPDGAKAVTISDSPPMILLSPSLYVDNSVPDYDYAELAIRSEDIDTWRYSSRHRFTTDNFYDQAVPIAEKYDPQQQKLMDLLAKQLAALDDASLPSLESLSSINPDAYGPFLQVLDSNRLTEEDRLLLEDEKNGRNVNFERLNSVREKERIQERIFLWIGILMTEDFSKCLRSFMLTPSLEDHIPETDARRIFRLGQYLALLNGPDMRARLARPGTPSPSRVLNHWQQANLICKMQVIGKFGKGESGNNAQRRTNPYEEIGTCLDEKAASSPGSSAEFAPAYRELAYSMSGYGNLEGARAQFQKAATTDRNNGDKIDTSRDLQGLGEALSSLEDMDGANVALTDALAIFKQTGEKDAQAGTLLDLSYLAYLHGNLHQVDRLLDDVDSLLHYSDAGILRSQELFYRANVRFARNDFAGADEMYEEARKGFDQPSLQSWLGSTLFGLARLRIAQGKPSQAIELLRDAAGAWQSDAGAEMEARAEVAVALLAMGKAQEAKKEVDLASANLAAKTHSAHARVRIAQVSAQVQAALGRSAEAEVELQAIVGETEKMRDVPWQLQSRLILGEMEMKSGHVSDGRRCLGALEVEAARKGFFRISRKAHDALMQ